VAARKRSAVATGWLRSALALEAETAPANNPTPEQCPKGYWEGLGVGAAGQLGIIETGAVAEGSLNGGIFHNSNSGTTIGGIKSGGATAYAGSHTAGAPQQGNTLNDRFVLGEFLGVGGGFFFTNAGSAAALASTKSTLSINIGWAMRPHSISPGAVVRGYGRYLSISALRSLGWPLHDKTLRLKEQARHADNERCSFLRGDASDSRSVLDLLTLGGSAFRCCCCGERAYSWIRGPRFRRGRLHHRSAVDVVWCFGDSPLPELSLQASHRKCLLATTVSEMCVPLLIVHPPPQTTRPKTD